MEAILIAVFAILFVMVMKITGESRQERQLKSMPVPRGYPIVGNLFDIIKLGRDPFMMAKKARRTFGTPYVTWLGSKPVVHIFEAKMVQVILSTKGITREVCKNSFLYGILKSQCKISSKGRKFYASFLSSRKEESLKAMCNENCSIFLEKALKNDIIDEKRVMLYVLDILCEIILGIRINSQLDENQSFSHSLIKLTQMSKQYSFDHFYSSIIYRVSRQHMDYVYHSKIVKNFIKETVKTRINETFKDSKKSENLLDYILIQEKVLEIEVLLGDLCNILLSSMKSIGTNTYTIICVLAHYKIIQQKIFQEITAVNGADQHLITNNDENNLMYLNNVIKETLRLFPPCLFLLRELEKDIKLENYILPHGITVCIQITNLHRDSNSFSNPEKFNPDNFLPENIKKRNPFAFIPFGLDEDKCINEGLTQIVQTITLKNSIKAFKLNLIEKSSQLISDTDIYEENILNNKIQFILRTRE